MHRRDRCAFRAIAEPTFLLTKLVMQSSHRHASKLDDQYYSGWRTRTTELGSLSKTHPAPVPSTFPNTPIRFPDDVDYEHAYFLLITLGEIT